MKVDMHTHTTHSGDSICTPAQAVRYAKRRGLNGLAVTDHNTTKGWKEMVREGRRNGVVVVLGEEIEVEKEGRVVGEVLGYFLNERIEKGEIEDVLDRIKEQGGIAALPHPFCFWRGVKVDVREYVGKLHAVEVLNSRVYLNSQNKRALEMARRYKLAEIGGSDAHCCWEVGNGFTEAEGEGAEELRKAIMRRKTKGRGGLTNPFFRVVSKIGITLPF